MRVVEWLPWVSVPDIANRHVVAELIDAKQDESWRHIQTILDSGHLTYTQNTHYYQVKKEKYLTCYKNARAGQTVFVLPDSASSPGRQVDPIKHFKLVDTAQGDLEKPRGDYIANQRQVLSLLAQMGHNVSAEDLGKLIPSDIYEEEMSVMAEVQAYFKVAYKVKTYPSCNSFEPLKHFFLDLSVSSITSRWLLITHSLCRSRRRCRTLSTRSWHLGRQMPQLDA